MELHYSISENDYVAFNLNYFRNNALVQRSILLTRVAAAALCLLGGTALMAWVKLLTPISVAVYVALAVALFFLIPKYMENKTASNVKKILQKANNKNLCGAKTLTVNESKIRLVGENEDTTYKLEGVHRIATDAAHFYLFVHEMNALIIPFTAFQTETQRTDFYRCVTTHIKDDALKC